MKHTSSIAICQSIIVFSLLITTTVCGAAEATTDPSKVDSDFSIQGEYTGTVTLDGEKQKNNPRRRATVQHVERLLLLLLHDTYRNARW